MRSHLQRFIAGNNHENTEPYMKYFPYELIAAANGWRRMTAEERQVAIRRFERAVVAYQRHLDRTRPAVSAAAWNFFRHGNPENTLHDSRLLSMSFGGTPTRQTGWSGQGRRPFATQVRLEFLTYAEDRLSLLECRGVRKIENCLFTPTGHRDLGDLYTYELRSTPNGRLALGFLFVTGATIDLEFDRLLFRMQRTRAPNKVL
jgi:hypothetical protein